METARIHDSLSEEVLFLWFDRTSLLPELLDCETIDLRICCGLGATSKDPVAFLIFWIPNKDSSAMAYALNELILNPTNRAPANR